MINVDGLWIWMLFLGDNTADYIDYGSFMDFECCHIYKRSAAINAVYIGCIRGVHPLLT